ncbi:hypothetical protein ArsFIN_25210 [Arsenophonus nasoniae]|uniref:Uncharacterized protein n=1 Tax=Arsenophonus nasoniae TaxID=638 RepID=D2TYP4_9GAMM|nr:hypothetical protein ArsFIN_25210 [Arsenophonus nasoniae]CBA72553.1 hypothetical protein ARN_12730 [Arsenophonus nasoniae]
MASFLVLIYKKANFLFKKIEMMKINLFHKGFNICVKYTIKTVRLLVISNANWRINKNLC